MDPAPDLAVPELAAVSTWTLYRRVRLVAIWRRPKLTACGDLAHDQVVAGVVARLLELPRRAVVLAEGGDAPKPIATRAGELDAARRPPAGPHPGQEPEGHCAGNDRGDHQALGVPAGRTSQSTQSRTHRGPSCQEAVLD